MKKITRSIVALVLAMTVVLTPVVVSAAEVVIDEPPVTIQPRGWVCRG